MLRVSVERMLAEGATFTELSVETLIVEAGMSRSRFYTYFESKGDLLAALVADATEDMLGIPGAWLSLPFDASPEDVRAAFVTLAKGYQENAGLLGALAEGAAYDEGIRELQHRMIAAYVKAVADHIKAGQKAGAFDPDLDAVRTASWLTWMVERGLQQLVVPATARERTRLAGVVGDIVSKTLAA